MKYVVLFVVPFLITLGLTVLVWRLFKPRRNIHFVPTGMGGIFVIAILFSFVFAYAVGITGLDTILTYSIGMFGMGFVGMINDVSKKDNFPLFPFRFKGLLKGDRQSAFMKGIFAIILGVWLGITMVGSMPTVARAAGLGILIALNVTGELYDIEKLINGNILLRTMDRWGA